MPGLDAFAAVLFDLDGVLTPTAEIHMHAWRTMFTAVFAEKGVAEPYTDDDYYTHLDGKQRVDGVAAMLESRDIRLPLGHVDDPGTSDTVFGVGNRKNDVFARALESEGIAPYPGSLALVEQLAAAGMPMGIVSSSKNAVWVLTAAHLLEPFPVIVDGLVATAAGLASKPAPDMFLHAAALMQVDPSRVAVFEDAISGVAAAHAGDFALVVGVDRGVGEQALLDAGADVVVTDLADFLTQTDTQGADLDA
ncbi:MAG: beta-phosphoglucomutase family hydrolase [Burkholderiaceae bacterium]|nr:beta-phosphoglucomutase family hydrolase [Microbacteriaceae bacterium]